MSLHLTPAPPIVASSKWKASTGFLSAKWNSDSDRGVGVRRDAMTSPRKFTVSSLISVPSMSRPKTAGVDESISCIDKTLVRHPPQSGWLDEWGRLKGGYPLV